jgi:hypothetical protein
MIERENMKADTPIEIREKDDTQKRIKKRER